MVQIEVTGLQGEKRYEKAAWRDVVELSVSCGVTSAPRLIVGLCFISYI